jgi:hypothetical protein
MLSYGSSITSSFPNTLCTSPALLTCQMCSQMIKDNSVSYYGHHSGPSAGPASANVINKLEKCTHCGLNICAKCFNENQEVINRLEESKSNSEDSAPFTKSQNHYQLVKKEFKQMYNYSKDIVEKLHLLNQAIKIEESTVSDLNLIKHQVNTKALELIKQINQEKDELIQQIENVKLKYEEWVLNSLKILRKHICMINFYYCF